MKTVEEWLPTYCQPGKALHGMQCSESVGFENDGYVRAATYHDDECSLPIPTLPF
jgi:hypothetical protein